MTKAERILELRRDHPLLPATAIAHQVGVSVPYVSGVLRRGAPPARKGSVRPLIEHLARETGLTGRQIATRLGCSKDYAEYVAQSVWAENKSGGGDNTVPKFAHHEDHLDRVRAGGGFCWLSESRGPKGHVAICLPINWPEIA